MIIEPVGFHRYGWMTCEGSLVKGLGLDFVKPSKFRTILKDLGYDLGFSFKIVKRSGKCFGLLGMFTTSTRRVVVKGLRP